MPAQPIWLGLVGPLLLAAAACSGGDAAGGASGSFDCVERPASDCPAGCEEAEPKIDADFWARWQAADADYVVRVDLRVRSALGERDAAQLAPCVEQAVVAVGGEYVTTFPDGRSVVARLTRPQGLAVAAYVAVERVGLADVPPPPAGSPRCVELAQAACEAREDCRFVEGHVLDARANCLGPLAPVGCTRGTLGGPMVGVWGLAPTDQCVYFPEGLLPEGWPADPEGCPEEPPPACANDRVEGAR